MSFKMNVSIKHDVEELVGKIREWIKQESGTFSGDTARGNIVLKTSFGTVKGNYVVNGSECVLEITEKPFMLPQMVIESKIKEALEKI